VALPSRVQNGDRCCGCQRQLQLPDDDHFYEACERCGDLTCCDWNLTDNACFRGGKCRCCWDSSSESGARPSSALCHSPQDILPCTFCGGCDYGLTMTGSIGPWWPACTRCGHLSCGSRTGHACYDSEDGTCHGCWGAEGTS
jgi:hypothetical protein